MNSVSAYMETELLRLDKAVLLRTLKEFSTAQNPVAIVDGREVLLFSSSNYLSFADNEQIKAAAHAAINAFGVGAGGSRLTTGTHQYHRKLETKLANFLDYEAALVFNSGYHANVGALSALADTDTVIFSDNNNHASIIDGCRLSKAKIVAYRHMDMGELESSVKKSPKDKKIIVSDGVFSMDGDIAPLPQLKRIAETYNAFLIIDDAHGLGVLGEKGEGIVGHFGGNCKPDLLIGTLSKALGSEGGFACGSANTIRFLQQKSRSFIFSTALSAANIAAADKGVSFLIAGSEAVKKLQWNISYMSQALCHRKIISKAYESAIMPIFIGKEEQAMQFAQKLWEQGIFIPAIRYPSVARGQAILRMTLMSDQSKAQLDEAITALEGLWQA